MDIPETRYAKSGDLHIAYQVAGDGPIDIVWVPGFVTHVEASWEDHRFARLIRRLTSFARVILLDKRGTGLSDRLPGDRVATLEQRIDDVRSVMDAAGSERAALFGWSEGGPMAVLFAATYPDRTSALVLYGTTARFLKDEGYDQGVDREVMELYLDAMEDGWGTGVGAIVFAPSVAEEDRFLAWWSRYQRQSASPGAVGAIFKMNLDVDVRHVLPAVHVPTLVMHRVDDLLIPSSSGRYLAEHIPGARYVELPGMDHLVWIGDQAAVADETEEFLTGARGRADPDRVFATVLFTDIVKSTERAAAFGDLAWQRVLEDHHAVVRHELVRFDGREVAAAGDGFLASFDGPERAIRCATRLVESVGDMGLEIRAGLHAGECRVMEDNLAGLTVHVGARVASKAGPREVLTSSAVKDLVSGSGIEFEDRGLHALKGVPGEWRLFSVVG